MRCCLLPLWSLKRSVVAGEIRYAPARVTRSAHLGLAPRLPITITLLIAIAINLRWFCCAHFPSPRKALSRKPCELMSNFSPASHPKMEAGRKGQEQPISVRNLFAGFLAT